MPKTQKRAPQKRADQSDNATKRTSTRTTTRKGKTSGNAGKAVTVDALVSMEITEVWVLYQGQPSDLIRNHLIENYLPLVRYTAERMHTRLPSEVDVEDLMSSGLFGLMDAIDAFDLDRGVKFETYCTQRIRGAIFDELRAMDWVPRLVRSRTAKVEKARRSIEMESGQKATEQEICKKLDVDKNEFGKLSRDSKPVGVVSLNRKWFETDSSKDVREIDVVRGLEADVIVMRSGHAIAAGRGADDLLWTPSGDADHRLVAAAKPSD